MHQVGRDGSPRPAPQVKIRQRVPLAVPLRKRLVEDGCQHHQHTGGQQRRNPAGQRQRPQETRQQPAAPGNVHQGDTHQRQIGGEVPGVGRAQRADHHPRQRQELAGPRPEGTVCFSAVPAPAQRGHRQAHGKHSHRQGHQVGVQVGVQEGEEGELGNFIPRPGGNGPAGVPVPGARPVGQLRPGQSVPQPLEGPDPAGDQAGSLDGRAVRGQHLQAVPDHAHRAQISDHQHEHSRNHPAQQRQPLQPEQERFFLIYRFAPPQTGLNQVPAHAEGSDGGDAVQRWQNQVVSHVRVNAQRFDQRADHNKAVIVVIDVPARIPGIVRREGGALDNRVQVGVIHRLFAALGRMPQVRIAQPH